MEWPEFQLRSLANTKGYLMVLSFMVLFLVAVTVASGILGNWAMCVVIGLLVSPAELVLAKQWRIQLRWIFWWHNESVCMHQELERLIGAVR